MEIMTSRLLLILRKDQTRDESELLFSLMWKESIELNLEGERQLNYYFKLKGKEKQNIPEVVVTESKTFLAILIGESI